MKIRRKSTHESRTRTIWRESYSSSSKGPSSRRGWDLTQWVVSTVHDEMVERRLFKLVQTALQQWEPFIIAATMLIISKPKNNIWDHRGAFSDDPADVVPWWGRSTLRLLCPSKTESNEDLRHQWWYGRYSSILDFTRYSFQSFVLLALADLPIFCSRLFA